MKMEALTGNDNYFEDFEVGTVLRHSRGKTVTNLENVLFTNMVLNTAQGHFNEHLVAIRGSGHIVVYGGVTFSMILGLSTQDCCENALAELGLDNVQLKKPVTHGDTLYAYSEILEKSDADREDAGIVRFRHYGYNQREELVVQVERTALIKRRTHWATAPE
ncbi:MaoC domain protein dehydratase [Sphingobium chlorophenolicum L-1]|uniref:MaoC domain protein dehydratase n=1 Tax=Sphingobium chlorophenolicum L-1 TaxID=690566 RepID=F6EW94_SPHCR|nr:MaoC family dehydratase [Sphingobium chlorophenolicum]AEG49788.1 MaoC domain protein dehydratase [Sphingobium chlorophenolicum L-1]